MRLFFSAVLVITLAISCNTPAPSSEKESPTLNHSKEEVAAELNTLLNTWYPRIIDTINGGYWTNFEYDWTFSKEQPKMLVTQARGLWTAARAAAQFPDNPVFKKAADHGFAFLTQHMWDTEHGGYHLYYASTTFFFRYQSTN